MEENYEMKDFPYDDADGDYFEGYSVPDDNTENTYKETKFMEKNYEVIVKENDKGERIVTFNENKKEAAKRLVDTENTKDFFKNILKLEDTITDKTFIDFLLDGEIFKIRKTEKALTTDYTVKYLGGDFFTNDGSLTDEETNLLRGFIRRDYDDWVKLNNKRVMKRAGIITAIGLSIIALVTGLSVGLTRKGNDMLYKNKKWENIDPSEKVDKIPWSDLTDAAGKSLIFTGKYFTVIIIFTVGYLIVKRKKKQDNLQ